MFDKVMVFLLVLVVVLLLVSTSSFLDAKREIAMYNKRSIESCYVLECNITFFGDLRCNTLRADVAFNITPSEYIELGMEVK